MKTKDPIPKEHELYVCEHSRKCGWRGRNAELVEKPDSKWPGSCTLTCPNCGGESFYIRDARTEPAPKLTPVQAFKNLHGVWLTASHRRDMNEQMDALAKALGLDAFTLKPLQTAK